MKRYIFRTVVALQVLFVMLVSGCISIDYVGQTYPEADSKEPLPFYTDAKEVPADTYKVIGRATATAPDGYSSEDIKQDLLSKARDCGADAVQVVDFKRVLVSRQKTPDSDFYNDGPTGSWGKYGKRADGSSVQVNVAGREEPLRDKVYNKYELVARVLFLRLNSRFIEDPHMPMVIEKKNAAE